ncbi:MAG: translation elongation factor Ts [Proteobacteria bacterium]|nr:translation elongation factor Ts [Pseudomonadota bacterium]
MATISAALVKQLRDATDASMGECKKALTECDGDLKKAAEYLQIKGIAKAAKRGARKTSEGYIGRYTTADGKGAALIEVSCETDFVARTDNFKNFCNDLARDLYEINPATDANLLDLDINGEKLEVKRGNLSASTGENIRIGRFVRMTVDNGLIGTYRHHDGKGAVAVKVACEKAETATNDAFKDFCSEVVLHVFACNPIAVSKNDIDPAAVADQRNVCRQKAAESGKPEAMLDKIAEGMLNKWYADVALLNQMWQGDGKESAEVKLNQCAKAVNDKLSIVCFSRIMIGEGVAEEEGSEE